MRRSLRAVRWDVVAAIAAVAAIPTTLLVGYWASVRPMAKIVADVQTSTFEFPMEFLRSMWIDRAEVIPLDSLLHEFVTPRTQFAGTVRNRGKVRADSVVLLISTAQYYQVHIESIIRTEQAVDGRIEIGALRPGQGAYFRAWTKAPARDEGIVLTTMSLMHSEGVGFIRERVFAGPYRRWLARNYLWTIAPPLVVFFVLIFPYRRRVRVSLTDHRGVAGES